MYPEAGKSLLSKWHFWLYNIGLPLLQVSMFMIHVGVPFVVWETFTMVGGTLLTFGVIVLVVNVFKNARGQLKVNKSVEQQ